MKYLYFICFFLYATHTIVSSGSIHTLRPKRLLGSKECTWGPTYWCSNLTAAAGCHAVRHCIQTVWEHQTLPPDTDSVCQTCLKMVKEARDQLLSNETEEEIKEVFEGSCKLIPIKLVNQECCKLVDDFIPELIDTLASQMNPQVVCSVAGLCNSQRIDDLLEEYETEKTTTISTCDGCHTVVDMLDKRFQKMSKDDVLQGFLRMCGQTSSFSDACSSIVITYFKEIYQHLQNDFNSDSICLLAGECSAQFHTHAVQITPLSKVGYVPIGQSDDLPCELCEQLVNHLRDILIANTTESEFERVLHGICNQTRDFKSECNSLVDQYYPVMYQFLLNELNSTLTCEMIGICPQETNVDSIPIVPLLPVNTAPKVYDLLNDNEDDLNRANVPNEGMSVKILTKPESMQLPIERLFPQVPDTYNKQVCVFCQYFLHYLQDAISDPTTTDKIKEEVDKACEKLPESVNATCIEFVNTYGDAVVALLAQEIDPSVICPLIKACPSSDEDNVEIFQEANVGQDKCPLCLFAVTELEEMIKNNNTEDNIKNALDKLCSHFSGNIAAECEDFVSKYTDSLVKMLVADLKPQQVCQYLKLCNSTLAEKPLLPVPKIEDVDILTNEIPDYTINGKFAPIKSVGNGQYCIICEFAMDKLQKLLENKTTEAKIKKDVMEICTHLPKSVNKECTDFVNEYADVVIQLIIASVEPDQICAYIGLCQKKSEHFEKPIVIDIPAEDLQDIQQPVGSPQCVICKLIMAKVEQYIIGRKTKDEIIHGLNDICEILPKSEEQSCIDFVAKHGDAIADMLLAFMQPSEICSALMVCSDLRDSIQEEITECSLCEAIYFTFNYMKQTRGKILPEHICNPMTEKYVQPCLDMLEKHAFAMSMYSSSDADTTSVCKELEYCKGNSAFVRTRRSTEVIGPYALP